MLAGTARTERSPLPPDKARGKGVGCATLTTPVTPKPRGSKHLWRPSVACVDIPVSYGWGVRHCMREADHRHFNGVDFTIAAPPAAGGDVAFWQQCVLTERHMCHRSPPASGTGQRGLCCLIETWHFGQPRATAAPRAGPDASSDSPAEPWRVVSLKRRPGGQTLSPYASASTLTG